MTLHRRHPARLLLALLVPLLLLFALGPAAAHPAPTPRPAPRGSFDPATGDVPGAVSAHGIRAAAVTLNPPPRSFATATYSYGPGTNQTFAASYDPTLTGQPWVIVLHGGSWSAGSPASVQNAVDLLTNNGYAVFNVAYRLITDYANLPGVPWAGQKADLIAARDYILAHAAEFGIDPHRGAVYGFSAGGHLAASLGLEGDGEYFRAVVSVSGVLQPQRLSDDVQGLRPTTEPPTPSMVTLLGWADAAMRCPFLTTWTDCAARWSAFEPETEISANDPPVLMMAGTADPLVPVQTDEAFAYHLNAAGVAYQLVEVAGMAHTDQVLFGDAGRVATFLAFLRSHTA